MKTPREIADQMVDSWNSCKPSCSIRDKIEQAIQAERRDADLVTIERDMALEIHQISSIKLREENLRMREVIEFYAHGTKHPDKNKQGFENEFGCGCCVGLQTDSGIELDFEMPGRAARRVLDQLQKESEQKC